MRFYFHSDAEAEFDDAVGYYEVLRTGLGLEFAREVYEAISRIVEFPNAWPPLSPNTRRCLVKRFPYAVIYQAKSDAVRIIAIANLRRRPGYWKTRDPGDE